MINLSILTLLGTLVLTYKFFFCVDHYEVKAAKLQSEKINDSTLNLRTLTKFLSHGCVHKHGTGSSRPVPSRNMHFQEGPLSYLNSEQIAHEKTDSLSLTSFREGVSFPRAKESKMKKRA